MPSSSVGARASSAASPASSAGSASRVQVQAPRAVRAVGLVDAYDSGEDDDELRRAILATPLPDSEPTPRSPLLEKVIEQARPFADHLAEAVATTPELEA